MADLLAEMYLRNPYLAAPWTQLGEGIVQGGIELANQLRAKREAEIERQRLARATPEYFSPRCSTLRRARVKDSS